MGKELDSELQNLFSIVYYVSTTSGADAANSANCADRTIVKNVKGVPPQVGHNNSKERCPATSQGDIASSRFMAGWAPPLASSDIT